MAQALFFTVLLVLLSKYIRINNPVFLWGGASLFPLYIYQRIPMIVFKEIPAVFNRPYLYFILSAVCTVAIALAYNRLMAIGKSKKRV